MTDKRYAIQTLPPPVLKEALGGVLYVHNLIDPAHGLVPVPEAAAQGDIVTLTVSNSNDAEQWSNSVPLPSPPLRPQLEFNIPKAVFEKMLSAETDATLKYSIERSGNALVSEPLKIELKH
ncbi:hypothetical protein [Pseudomonas sp. S3_G06]|jgi:hypothetical protein